MKYKKIISILLCMLILSISLSDMLYADNKEKSGNNLKFDEKTQKMIDKVLKEHKGVKLVPIDECENLKSIDKNNLIQINSEEDFNALINTLRSTAQIEGKAENNIMQSIVAPQSIDTYYKHISWYSPASSILSSLLCWKNITFNYTLNGITLTNLSNIKSYISGINVCTWTQNNAYYSIIGAGSGANITIDGYYLTGIKIGGQPAGVVINDTWYRTWYWD